ncbi:MAG: DNA polymerase III subunit gamma/tau [Flavobacteriales bacterium]|nr:DNA polymerase III subunit gamma/tau [Flavobacteriales bacterium]MBK6943444.1 DNA polymerase III subunit gamma/tau [Flavobacteriales bacterium]MBK7240669.1 DNA polymerase III subunit gamma/tau [Flavobacteriales bacterium]MBK9536020.1 DNA polymerase III subunit gamma/tau [Flavobacteriales bacterium]MBP9139083.1 DNA polymerase III subunit gamma/tau [Flavobacteriales bacterium]
MEQFVVSARKYRPATFDTVVGQEAVTGTLKNAIKSDHLAQAFLFTGPRGVGKTTCARILARTINCENLSANVEACGTCAPCKDMDDGHSLNIFELDAASNNSVEDIRSLILQVSIAPQVGAKKVYIIDEVHMLSPQAFNAFLKTLEEPPSYAIFILATTEKHKIIPTILSRCQVFDFRRITVADISKHLSDIATKEGITAEPQALHTIAKKADGGLRDALSIFDQLVSFAGNTLTYKDVLSNLNVLDHEHYFRITDNIIAGDSAAALVEYNSILQQGFDGHLFVTGLGRHFRDLLVSQDPRTLPLLEVSEDLTKRYGEQAQAADRALIIQGLDKLAQTDTQYKLSKEPRLLVELALIQLCNVNVAATVAAPQPSSALPEAQKKSPDVAVAPTNGRVRSETNGNATVNVVAEPLPEQEPPTPAEEVTAPISASSPRSDNYVPKRRLAGQVSIKRSMEAVAETEPEMAASVDTEHGSDALIAKKEVNPALLLKVWRDYTAKIKNEGKISVASTLAGREPQAVGISKITFAVVNNVQENYMRTEKPELLGYLRRQMGDMALEMEVIKEKIVTKPRYTTLDKFKLMAEKNPALFLLQKELDLDLG